MANVKITELTALTAADSASTDVLPVVDVSADATKKLAISDLHRSVPDGTLSAPGIAFQSDLNSGLYRSGTDAIALVTNGAARILIDATGNVTIPNDLTVQGATTFITGQTVLIEDKNIELGVVSTPTNITADGGGITLKGTTDKTIQWVNSTGAWTFNQPVNMIGGNVGIGTSNPGETLHVNGTATAIKIDSNGDAALRFATSGTNKFSIYHTSGGTLNFFDNTNSQNRLKIDSSGRLLVGGASVTENDHANIDANGTLTIRRSSGEAVYVKKEAATRLYISADGGVNSFNNALGFISYDAIFEATSYRYAQFVATSSEAQVVAGAVGSLDTPLVFKTSSSGTEAERLKITSTGSAEFKGSVLGSNIDVSSSSGKNGWKLSGSSSTDLTGKLELQCKTGAASSTKVFEVFNGNTSTSSVAKDGSASYAGNVGIGTTSPAFSNGSGLEIQRDGVSTLRIEDSSGLGAVVEIFADDGSRSAIYDSRGNSSNHGHEFRVNGSPKVNINSSGNVGIGTTSPGRLLEVNNDGETFIRIKSSNTGNAGIEFGDQSDTVQGAIFQNSTDNSLRFNGYNNSEAMRIDSSGNVGIGTVSPTSIAGYTGVTINNATNGGFLDLESNETAVFRFLTNGTVNNIETRTATPIVFLINTNERARIDSSGRLLVGVCSSSVANAAIFQGNSSGSDVGVVTIATETASPANGSLLGILDFSDNGHKRAARIECSRDGGTWTSNSSHPSRLAFYTTADGASSTTERMRIDSSGVIDFTGPGYTPSTNSCFIKQDSSGEGYLYNRGNNDLLFGTNNTERMRIDNSGNVVLKPTNPAGVSGTNTNYLGFRITQTNGQSALLGTINAQGQSSWGGDLVFSTKLGNGAPNDSVTERMRIDSDGNVAIGTTSANSERLNIMGPGHNGQGTTNTRSVISYNLTSSNVMGLWFGARTDETTGIIGSRTATGNIGFETYNGGWGERMRITSSGNVGIGDLSPNTNLVVKGASNSLTNSVGNINVISTDSAAINAGGSIGLGGFYNGTSNSIPFANLHGKKENGTGNNAAGYFAISTRNASSGTAERMRIDSSGNVGIGTTSPGEILEIKKDSPDPFNTVQTHLKLTNGGGNAGAGNRITFATGATQALIQAKVNGGNSNSGTDLEFYTHSTTGTPTTPRMILDTSGRLLVGTSTARANFYNSTISALFQQEGATSLGDPASRFMSFTYGKGNSNSGVFIFAKHRATTVGGQTVVVNEDRLGELNFQGSDGTEFVQAASIIAAVDGTPGANDMPGRLVFSTTADGESSPTPRMRIDSDGRLLIGGTSTADDNHANINANGVLTIRRAAASNDCIVIKEGSTESLLIEAAGNVYNYNVGSFAFTSWDNEFGTSGPYASLGSFGGEARITAGSTASDDVPLVFRTASSGTLNEEMRLLPGGGLTFNGDTAQANALDDYEEGTWTPTIRENGSGAAWDTIAANNGYYTKIGDCVTFSATFNYSGVATNVTGGFYGWLAGFPFASSSSKKSGQFFISFLYAGVRTVLYGGVFIGGNAYAGIHKDQDSTSPGTMMTNEYPTGAHTVKFQGHYYV
jgi:hypothetical protein